MSPKDENRDQDLSKSRDYSKMLQTCPFNLQNETQTQDALTPTISFSQSNDTLRRYNLQMIQSSLSEFSRLRAHTIFFALCCLGKIPGGAPFSQLHKSGNGSRVDRLRAHTSSTLREIQNATHTKRTHLYNSNCQSFTAQEEEVADSQLGPSPNSA